jgi:hypothetical protein
MCNAAYSMNDNDFHRSAAVRLIFAPNKAHLEMFVRFA